MGLGYIGLPTALISTSSTYKVTGFDIDKNKVDELNSGKYLFDEQDIQSLYDQLIESNSIAFSNKITESDIFVIAVPTPIKTDKSADLSYVENAIDLIIPLLKKDNLIILESTCPVGTSELMIKRIIKKRDDLKNESNIDFKFCYCPERILPGDTLNELINNDRVIGGNTKEASMDAVHFYKSFIDAKTNVVDLRTAEMSKLIENSYRDVNIAFANEIMRLAKHNQVDHKELIEAANKHPRVNILKPGPGVGGHCIAIDPWFLATDDNGICNIITSARKINDEQPNYVFNLIKNCIEKTNPKSILFAGLSYKKNSSDVRESPSLKIADMIFRSYKDIELIFFDPFITKNDIKFNLIKDSFHNKIEDIQNLDLSMIIKSVDHDYFGKNRAFQEILLKVNNIFDIS